MLNYYKKMQLFIILIVLIFPNVSSLNKAYAEGDNNLNIRVSNIPSNIGNLKLLVEGSNGISYLLREETKGQGTLNVGVKLPVGNTYRIRVIGYNAGETFPQVIVGGEVKSLSVTEGQTNNAAISLERAKVELDESTPRQVEIGSSFTIKMKMYDPANFLADVIEAGRLYWDTGYGTEQKYGGKIRKIGDKQYEYTINVEAPMKSGQVSFNFGESNHQFNSPEGTEAPFFNSEIFSINVVEAQPNVNISVSNIPSNIGNLKLLVEGSNGISYLLREETKGQGTLNVGVKLPVGNTYRIRVIGYNAGETFPQVIVGGEVKSLSVTEGQTNNAAISLERAKVELDESTPRQVEIGSSFTIKMKMYDPANFLADVIEAGRLYWDTGYGTEQKYGGKIRKIGDKQYEYTINVEAPMKSGQVSFNFGESNYLFDSREGTEAPFFNSEIFSINVVEAQPNVNIRVSNIPSNIGNLKLLVEGSNGISYLLREETKGQGTLNVGVKLPVGNTYRIRVIGYNAGVTFPQVIVGGEVKSLSVTEGQTNNAAISLERAKVELDESTPRQVEIGSSFTIKMKMYDPANFLADVIEAGRLYWDTGYGTEQKYGGKIRKISDKQYEYTINVEAPMKSGQVSFNFGESNYLFDSREGTEAPFFNSEVYKVEVGDVNTFLKINPITNIDKEITGKAQIGSIVYAKIQGQLYFDEVNDNGEFSVSIPSQTEGTHIEVWSVNKKGSSSEIRSLSVEDIISPEKPFVDEVTDSSTTVTGKAEKGSTISIKKDSIEIGSTVTQENGQFTVSIPVQKAGTELVITATDKAGNVSEATTVVVKDITPPAKPVVNEVTDRDTSVTGQAEAGSKVDIKINGSVIGSASAGIDGKFAVAIPVQQAGTELFILATDKDGNVSEETKIVVSTVKAKLSGWVQENGTWYFYDKTTGEKKTGWYLDGATWYFLDNTGAMKTGWLKDGSTWYFLNNNGGMKTGWLKDGNTWYFLNNSGAMKTGWLKDGNVWYFLNSSGAMKTGWLKDGTSWYFLNTSGAMKTGWLLSGSTWYFLTTSGAMQTGWAQISGKWYYFNQSGALE